MKIIVADDSALMRGRISLFLSVIDGVEIVGTAGDGQTLIDSFDNAKPDVLVLDFKLFKNYRTAIFNKIKNCVVAPILILLTNNSYPQYRNKYLDVGVEFVFDKSIEFEKLVHLISGRILRQVA